MSAHSVIEHALRAYYVDSAEPNGVARNLLDAYRAEVLAEQTTELARLRTYVRTLAEGAETITTRHPGCGAVAELNMALSVMPASLRVAMPEGLLPHPDDDSEDDLTEQQRLRRRVADLEARLRQSQQLAFSPTEVTS